ncbi:MAG: zinc ABC transporter ATP-binding protein ZnuC [Gammaproteobacteria bacterium]|nr:MAG: zinc ABC transporter ATP-binding protein ZnuC [Gammaproteobacteria bacterium]
MKSRPLIVARNIHVHKKSKVILSDINLQINSGEIVTIIGPNGSGKTTLLKILMKLEKPNNGKIFSPKNLKIGYLPQKINVPSLLPIKVSYFLNLYKNKQQNIHLHNYLLKELKIENILKQQITSLSGGEIQRVLLVRAIMNIPRILILDEPTSSMDISGQNKIYNLISQISHRFNIAVIMVSHDLHMVMAKSQRVICLNRHICCSGTPKNVLQHPEYKKLFTGVKIPDTAIYTHKHNHTHSITNKILR